MKKFVCGIVVLIVCTGQVFAESTSNPSAVMLFTNVKVFDVLRSTFARPHGKMIEGEVAGRKRSQEI